MEWGSHHNDISPNAHICILENACTFAHVNNLAQAHFFLNNLNQKKISDWIHVNLGQGVKSGLGGKGVDNPIISNLF